MRRALIGLVVVAAAAAGCSSASMSAPPPSTTASTSTTSGLSRVALDRRVCSAYKTFWDSDVTGAGAIGPSPSIEKAVIDAAEATPDQSLHDAVRGVIEGELGLPRFYLHDSAAKLRQEASALPADARAALAAVEQNQHLVEATCAQLGRPIGS